MLYCRIENEKLAHLVVIGGTQVAWQGQDLVSATGPCAFFEWRRGAAVGSAAAGDFSLSPLFEQLTGETIMGIDAGGGSHSSKVGLNRNSSSYAEKQ
jgi:hypothetical protein